MIKHALLYVLMLFFAGCAASDDVSERSLPAASTSLEHIWAIDIDQRKPAEAVGFSQPAVTAEGLIVMGGQDARIHTYQSDGREIGRIAISAACDSGAQVLSNGWVVLGDVRGVLYAMNPETQKIMWTYSLSSPFTGKAVVVEGGFVLQTSDNRIYRFSESGEKLWSYAGSAGGLSMYLNASPMVLDGVVYAVFGNGDAVAVRLENGNLRWRHQLLLANDAPVLSELKVVIADPIAVNHAAVRTQSADQVLLVGFYQGDVLFLAREDGSQQFSHPLSIKSAPIVLGDTLYISDVNGFVHAIDQNNGQTMWKKKLTHGELVGPVVWKNKLWFADDRGQVLRLNLDGTGLASGLVNGRVDRAPWVTDFGVLVRSDIGALHLFN